MNHGIFSERHHSFQVKKPRLIAVDVDGTLLHSDGQISPRNLSALRLAEQNGVEVVIATGRRHSFAMRVLRSANLNPASALISSNGTVIRTVGADLIHRHQMPISTALWLCKHVAEFRRTLVMTFDKVGADGDDSHGALVCEDVEDLHASIGRWMQSNAPYIAHVAKLEDALLGTPEQDPPIQMMLCGTASRMAEAEARLLQHPLVAGVGMNTRPDTEITLHRTIYPDRDLSIVDILPAGCSKASALRQLAELRGISMAEVTAIGDNWNDVPMLEAAGQAVLMSNAPAELHQLAAEHGWRIAPSNDEDGVAFVLESVFS
jgi:hydroxymethylpyrimidine pyrophosphatase-like HAD family hydrolase